jgi:hypothetical protein
MEACRNKYCPRFETQQPDLCQGYDPVYATAGGAPRAAEDATEFLAAMLALVHDRDRKDDSVQEVAALQAGRFAHVYQVVNTPLPSLLPQDDAKAAALGLTVSITPEGFTITGKDLEPKRIAAAGPGDTEALWDWAGLEAEARRLKSLHPEVGTVTLRPDASIPLAVLTRVMDAMRGSDCDPLDDASKCLFFDVIVDRSG